MNPTVISTSKLRDNMSEALDSVEGSNILVVTRRGKPEKAIVDLDEYEDLLAASNPAYLEKIRKAREDTEFFSHEDVFGDI